MFEILSPAGDPDPLVRLVAGVKDATAYPAHRLSEWRALLAEIDAIALAPGAIAREGRREAERSGRQR